VALCEHCPVQVAAVDGREEGEAVICVHAISHRSCSGGQPCPVPKDSQYLAGSRKAAVCLCAK
jgi:hypothetical protein